VDGHRADGRPVTVHVSSPLPDGTWLIELRQGPASTGRVTDAAAGTIVNVSSDAAVEAYPGWGGYGSAKAALDQLTSVLAAEEQALRCYAFDPGDMRTDMHQQAYPGEDISDRPEPETVVPALLRLLAGRPPSGRYRAGDLAAPAGPPAPAVAP